MKNIMYPDYNNSIANLACSVLKYYGIEPPNDSLKIADDILKKEYKNVVLVLLDGMGMHILEKHLEPGGFFRKHLIGTYSSVFPPTTVAATTSVLSGLFPNQHCWLGWDCYFKELDKNVTVFSNTEQMTGEKAADYSVAGKYCPYTNILDRISDAGIAAHFLAPFRNPFPSSFQEECAQIKDLCREAGRKYIYAYWDDPDTTMHRHGTGGDKIRDLILNLEKDVENLVNDLEDTLVLVTADHGHLDTGGVVITDYPDLCECLVRMPSIEPRALNLFVKDGMAEKFSRLFNEHFHDQFLLFSKREVIEKKLFGTGVNSMRLNDMLGDFLAVATGGLTIFNTAEEQRKFKSAHAGITSEEMIIPLIAADNGDGDAVFD